MAAALYPLKIAGIIQETPDTRSFVFAVPPEHREVFSYKAGQFLTFEIPWNGMRLRRCYSLASSPDTDPWHKVTVKRVVDGRVSNWFNDELAVGDTIEVIPPEGRFVLRADAGDRGVVLFGAGSGITPVIALMKSALRTTDRRIKLVYANRDADSIIFKDEIDLWRATYPNRLDVHHHLDSDGGFMTIRHVEELCTGWEESDFYVCGPGPFMDTVEAGFEALSIDAGQTHFERFVSPVDEDRKDPAAGLEEPAPGDAPATFTMTLEGATAEVPYKPGSTLLQSAVAAGYDAPSSCEDGYCGCCMAQMKHGSVQMASREALTDDDIDKGWILTCQAKPNSSEQLEIDFDAVY
ncbi:MAG: ferredoxin--NADP reductase [Myxococcales bacterium]|nr:ferredoxin--NADP reductase [Myxococcales bacterium]